MRGSLWVTGGSLLLAGLVCGALLLGLATVRARQGAQAATLVARVPPEVLPAFGGATLLISLRDVCAFVSVGDFRRELRLPNVFGLGPARTACTPFFPRGSDRR